MSRDRPSQPTCLDTDAPAGRRAHAWQSTGLDEIAGQLCTTRKCVWCGRREHKPYGARRAAWRTEPETTP